MTTGMKIHQRIIQKCLIKVHHDPRSKRKEIVHQKIENLRNRSKEKSEEDQCKNNCLSQKGNEELCQ